MTVTLVLTPPLLLRMRWSMRSWVKTCNLPIKKTLRVLGLGLIDMDLGYMKFLVIAQSHLLNSVIVLSYG